ncbi:MAG: hypothetical protein Q4G04_06465 [bacterium]|nr:hypothetical protein [bacterium]
MKQPTTINLTSENMQVNKAEILSIFTYNNKDYVIYSINNPNQNETYIGGAILTTNEKNETVFTDITNEQEKKDILEIIKHMAITTKQNTVVPTTINNQLINVQLLSTFYYEVYDKIYAIYKHTNNDTQIYTGIYTNQHIMPINNKEEQQQINALVSKLME